MRVAERFQAFTVHQAESKIRFMAGIYVSEWEAVEIMCDLGMTIV